MRATRHPPTSPCARRPLARARCRHLAPAAAASSPPFSLYPTGPSTGDGDTIAALATADAPAAVAVVRVSGPRALAVAASVFRPAAREPWPATSHTIAYGHAVDPASDSDTAIDEVLALTFRAPRSYTREDVVELHTHGGGVCAARVLAALNAAGARAARPGEFTLRAFLSGRLSLDQAEAVADLVTARTRSAADAALAGLGPGGVGATVTTIRADALSLLARVEAGLDFDEGDVPDVCGDDAVALLTPLRSAIAAALATAGRGGLLRRGATAALVGAPNVGKSSLLNALAGADRAIVAAEAGTTRDVVTADAVVAGIALTVCDTAGVREAPSAVEAAGVTRAGGAAAASDVVVVVFDASAGWTPGDAAALAAVADAVSGGGGGLARAPAARPPRAVLVANKADVLATLPPGTPLPPPPAGLLGGRGPPFDAIVTVSAATGDGLEALRSSLAITLGVATSPETGGTAASAVNARQADALTRAAAALACAEQDARNGAPSDLWSGGVRDAVIALGDVTGTDAREEVLDAVFSKFCIGK